MPVVDLEYPRLEELVGPGTGDAIRDALPFLGLDVESESGGVVRAEYSPNRPDYSTEYGIALGLQGLTGTRTGLYGLDIAASGYLLHAEPAVSDVRPSVTCITARGGRVDDRLIRQLMAMQEDLHSGLGRRRRRSSIGIHDLGSMSFPLRYTTVPRNHSFVPLDSAVAQPISGILEGTPVGRRYSHMLEDHAMVPVILDAKDQTISLPPVINSALTTVTTDTRDLLVEVTGLDRGIEDVLAVAAVTLQAAGFELFRVDVTGAGNSTPALRNREVTADAGLVAKTLGSDMTHQEIVSSLAKCRLDAQVQDGTIRCTVPPYRFDILGPMDIVEEVALGYGIRRLQPVLSPSQVIGQKDPGLERLNRAGTTMIGLGYLEAMGSSLTNSRVLYDIPGRDPSEAIPVASSKSREHTILRDAILPGLVESLSRNVHEPYPQRLFEIGTVFLRASGAAPVEEQVHLACVNASGGASFSGTKSVLQALLGSLGEECTTSASCHPLLAEGRAAEILLDGRRLGYVGEVGPEIIRNLRIRVPVAAFEVDLDAEYAVHVVPGLRD